MEGYGEKKVVSGILWGCRSFSVKYAMQFSNWFTHFICKYYLIYSWNYTWSYIWFTSCSVWKCLVCNGNWNPSNSTRMQSGNSETSIIEMPCWQLPPAKVRNADYLIILRVMKAGGHIMYLIPFYILVLFALPTKIEHYTNAYSRPRSWSHWERHHAKSGVSR